MLIPPLCVGAQWRVMARDGASSLRRLVLLRCKSSVSVRVPAIPSRSAPCKSSQVIAIACRWVALDSQRYLALPYHLVSSACLAFAPRLLSVRLDSKPSQSKSIRLRIGSVRPIPVVAFALRFVRGLANPVPIAACPLHAQLFRSSAARLRSHLCCGFSSLIYSVAARLKSRLCLAIQ